MKKVAIIVVTYNRKELLQKCIECLNAQTFKNFDILVIDNASTDGTRESLEKYIKDEQILYFNTEKNIGGAGGFNFGMKIACEKKYEYVWLMDDDTMPEKDSLNELMIADEVLKGNYGFLASVVLWKDGTYCKMNKQKIQKLWYEKSELLKYGLLKTYHSTFVSFFIKLETIQNEGLPIKDFFIWGDDVEYTNRLSKKYDCYIAGKSQVNHFTNNNEGSNIAKDDVNRLNRYKFAYRNEVYIAKKNGVKGIFRQIAKIFLHIFRVIFSTGKYKLKKIYVIVSSSIRGIWFNPKVEFVDKE